MYNGYTFLFLIFALKHRLWDLNEAVLMRTHNQCFSKNKTVIIIFCLKINFFTAVKYYIIIDFNEVDIRIYLPEKVIFTEAARPR